MISCTVFTENYAHTDYLNEMQTLSSAFSAPGEKKSGSCNDSIFNIQKINSLLHQCCQNETSQTVIKAVIIKPEADIQSCCENSKRAIFLSAFQVIE